MIQRMKILIKHLGTVSHWLAWIGFYLILWVGRAFIVASVGAVIGAVVGPMVNLAVAYGMPFLNAVQTGAWIGFKYLGLWSLGLSLVWCVMTRERTRTFMQRRFASES